MIEKEKGIILKKIRYSDSQLIVHVFTRNHGFQSLIIAVRQKSKTDSLVHLIQPLYLVDIEYYFKSNNQLHRLKSLYPAYVFTSIPYHADKTAIVLFVASLLNYVVKYETHPHQLFDFIELNIKYLDKTDNDFYDFHVFILVHILRFLGIIPELNHAGFDYFDILTGSFVKQKPDHNLFFYGQLCHIFTKILQITNMEYSPMFLTNNQRRQLLSGLTEYLKRHSNLFSDFNEYKIIQDLYQE